MSSSICTSIINNDTCIINQTSSWTPSIGNITCDPSLANCIISCQSTLSCSNNWSEDILIIQCPPNAHQCDIQCIGSRSCRYSQIFTNNANHTNINIIGNNAGREITIYASGHLDINVMGIHSDLYQSIIYAQSNSNIINLNCIDADVCTNNIIYARNTQQAINIMCGGDNSDCSNSDIWCPMNVSNCNVYCHLCQNMNIYAQNTDAINWQCAQNEDSCFDSKLICNPNKQEMMVDMIWDTQTMQWIFENGKCSPTSLPTIDPTSNPTQYPSMEPSIYPTEIPTIMPIQIPSMEPSLHPTIYPTLYPTPDVTEYTIIQSTEIEQRQNEWTMQPTREIIQSMVIYILFHLYIVYILMQNIIYHSYRDNTN